MIHRFFVRVFVRPACILVLALSAAAQQPGGPDPVADNLFSHLLDRVKESDVGGVTSFRFGVATLEIDTSTNPPTAKGDLAGGSHEFLFPKATPKPKPAPKPKKPKPKKKL